MPRFLIHFDDLSTSGTDRQRQTRVGPQITDGQRTILKFGEKPRTVKPRTENIQIVKMYEKTVRRLLRKLVSKGVKSICNK